MDRNAQKAGILFSGVEGIGMQDASLQESMGPIVDRSLENLVGTDRGIVMMRRALLRAADANKSGGALPGLDAATQQVRSCAIELPRGTPFQHGARAGLFPELFSDPVTV
jgi:phthalate 4,5-dioxygenase